MFSLGTLSLNGKFSLTCKIHQCLSLHDICAVVTCIGTTLSTVVVFVPSRLGSESSYTWGVDLQQPLRSISKFQTAHPLIFKLPGKNWLLNLWSLVICERKIILISAHGQGLLLKKGQPITKEKLISCTDRELIGHSHRGHHHHRAGEPWGSIEFFWWG